MVSYYLERALSVNNQKETVRRAVKALREIRDEFDVIAASGNSGVVIASIVAYEMGKPLAIVRKDADQSHACTRVECDRDFVGKYVVIDDLIASGKTMRHIAEKMEKDYKGAKCILIYLYSSTHHSSYPWIDGQNVRVVADSGN